MPRKKPRKEFIDGYVSISATIDKINRSFRHNKLKPNFDVEKFVCQCVKRTKPDQPRTAPFLPHEIINHKVRILKSDIRVLTDLLLSIERQAVINEQD